MLTYRPPHSATLALVAMIALGASLAAAPAYAQTCQQLWVQRNQYYKNHGYCFKTQRAIEYFGNGGCYINDENAVPLTSAERASIAQIGQQERAMGCDTDGGGSTGMTCDQLWVARNSIYRRAATASRRNALSSISAMVAACTRTRTIFLSRKPNAP
jgi:hypothetical protein